MQHDIATQVATNLKERLLILGVLKLQTEITPFLPKGTEYLFVLDPLRTHVLPEIIDEAQERIQSRRRIKLKPTLELIHLLRLDRSPAPVENAAPELDGWLVELPLRQPKL